MRYIAPPAAGTYVAKTPDATGWTSQKRRKSPGLYSLWAGREAGRTAGTCYVCGTDWQQPERIGCGGCNDLSAWWPRPGVSDAETWHSKYGTPPESEEAA